jgi:HK97 family phage portal protein
MNYAKLRAFSESAIPRRAISYIKDQVSMLPWGIRVKGGKEPNGRQKKEIAMLVNMLNNPNPNDSWRTFIEQFCEDMLVVGCGAAEKRKWEGNPDQPAVFYPVDGASIEIYVDWDGNPDSPRYAQRDRNGNVVNFTPNELMYVRMNPRTNSPFGLSPLEAAAQNIEYLLAAMSLAGRNASLATPDRALDLGEEVTPEQVRQYRIYWQDEVVGKGVMPIIGGTKGAKSIPLSATSDEELFLKWQSFLIVQIGNAFGIDPQKFGALVGVTRATGDILDDATDESAIRPLAHTIEAAINREILHWLGYDEYEFFFQWTGSFQDRKALAAINQVYVQMNVITLDEARAEIGLPPLPDGKGAMTLAEHLALYGGNNHMLGPDAEKDASVDTGTYTPRDSKNHQDPTQNPNALNQENRAGQTSKVQTRKDKPMNQARDPMKIEL